MSERMAAIVTDSYVAAARLERRRGRWSCAEVHCAAVNTPAILQLDDAIEPLADAVLEAVRATGPVETLVGLIVPVAWCFTRKLEWKPKRFSEPAAKYQLEEFLPLTLEEVTCAFARDGTRRVWAVAAATEPLKRLLDELEARHVNVAHVHVDLFAALSAVPGNGRQTVAVSLRDTRHAALGLRNGASWLPEVVRALHLPSNDGADHFERQRTLTEGVIDADGTTWLDIDMRPNGHTVTCDRSPSGDANASKTPSLGDLLLSTVTRADQPDLRTGSLEAPNRLGTVTRLAVR
jgi:hypothetical protein